MKVLIVCRPRTRSTLLIDALSKYHNLEDKDENYKFCFGKVHFGIVNDDMYYNLFMGYIKTATQNNFKQDNFAIKLYPRMMTFSQHKINNLDDYQLKIIPNLTYFTNIRKYDKVYFLTRNLIDSICSWAYGNHINYYNFRDHETLISKTSTVPNLTIDLDNDPELKFYILESAILDVWKKFLDDHISHTTLDYYDLPNYVSNTYPNIVNKTIDSKLDYTKIITNYHDLEEKINNYYQLCYEKVKNIPFR